jgi:hypothetical protein
MAGRYSKNYSELLYHLDKLTGWVRVIKNSFVPAMREEDVRKAKRLAYDAAKYIPYYTTKVVTEMHSLAGSKAQELEARDGENMKGADVISELVKVANDLDADGRYDEADLITEAIRALAYADFGAEHPEPDVSSYQFTNSPTLSTRSCPDHRGVSMIPESPGRYRCPLDNKTYDFNTGFTDAAGVKYRGGDVANQTPDSVDWGQAERPRWFEK